MTTCVRCRLEVDPYDDDGVEFTFTESTGMVHTSCEFNFLRDELSRLTTEHEMVMERMRGLLGRARLGLRMLLGCGLPARVQCDIENALAESDPEAKT